MSSLVRINSPAEPLTVSKTSSHTLVAADKNRSIVMNSSSATTLTVNAGVFKAGDVVWVDNVGSGVCTITEGTATVNLSSTTYGYGLQQFDKGVLYFNHTDDVDFYAASFNSTITVDFVVVAGGGAGGNGSDFTQLKSGGGGGAGGYRSSYGTSGGGASAENPLTLLTNHPYSVVVGAGGVVSATLTEANGPGNFSQFASIFCVGGGLGNGSSTLNELTAATLSGGSGGGEGGIGTTNQGYNGGGVPSGDGGSGGGGAGAAGATATSQSGANGGNGVSSVITGELVSFAGGGGGGGYFTSTPGSGGNGGGGDGGNLSTNATAGAANSGGGGGGGMGERSGYTAGYGGQGGSGVVIFQVPDTTTVTFSAGVTSSTSTIIGGYKVITVTATSTLSETVTFN